MHVVLTNIFRSIPYITVLKKSRQCSAQMNFKLTKIHQLKKTNKCKIIMFIFSFSEKCLHVALMLFLVEFLESRTFFLTFRSVIQTQYDILTVIFPSRLFWQKDNKIELFVLICIHEKYPIFY